MIWLFIIVVIFYFLFKSDNSTSKSDSINARYSNSQSTNLNKQSSHIIKETHIDPNYSPITNYKIKDETYLFFIYTNFDDREFELRYRPHAADVFSAYSILCTSDKDLKIPYFYDNYIYFWFGERRRFFGDEHEVFRGHDYSFVRMKSDCTDKEVLLSNCQYIINDKFNQYKNRWLYFIQYKPSVKIYRFNITKKELVIDPNNTNEVIVDNYTFRTVYDQNNQPIEITVSYEQTDIFNSKLKETIHVPLNIKASLKLDIYDIEKDKTSTKYYDITYN